MILFLIAFRRRADSSEGDAGVTGAVVASSSEDSPSSSSLLQQFRMAMSISVTVQTKRSISTVRISARTESLTLLANEWKTPGEDVHEIREPIWMRRAVELSDVHHVALVLQDSRLVVVHVEVVRGAEDSHDGREACRLGLAVHAISQWMGEVSMDVSETAESTNPASCAS